MNNMRISKSGKNKGSGKGFYVALALCICAVSVVGWNSFGNKSGNPQADTTSQITSDFMDDLIEQYPLDDDVAPTEAVVSGIKNESSEVSSEEASSSSAPPVSSDSSEASSKKASSAVSSEEALSQTMQPLVYTLPSGTVITKEFSGTSPVYSLTFNDWRIHEGTDFKADLGSPVKAVSDGKVLEVYKDDMYGNVVVIDHFGGLEVYYCGLGDTSLVKVGNNVTTGEEIGSVGKIPCEVLEETHLHLMTKVNGKLVDPMTALGKR